MCVVRPIRPFSSDLYSTLQQCYPSLDERANQRLEIGNGQITLPPTPPPPFCGIKVATNQSQRPLRFLDRRTDAIGPRLSATSYHKLPPIIFRPEVKNSRVQITVAMASDNRLPLNCSQRNHQHLSNPDITN